MGIELIGVVLFARLIEVSQFLREHGGLIFFTATFLILWACGVIAAVRRWEGR